MLKLSKNDFTPVGNFKDYYELYQHIRDQENAKLLESHPEFGQTKWSFVVLPPARVVELYNALNKKYKLEILASALKEKCGVIEMCQNDGIHLVVASPGVDIEGFRKDFCDDYCHAHKLVITECD